VANPVQEPGPGPGRRRVHPLLWILITLGVLGAIGLGVKLALDSINRAVIEVYMERDERFVVDQRLMAISDAQDLVRAGTGSYWREDVAGLADFPLIDVHVAQADAGGRRKDLCGYLFRALPFSDESTPDPARYAVLCFPVGPRGFMYVLAHDRQLWKKPAIAGGVDVFPADPAAEGWEKTP
jgi:hypothetical protein